MRSLLRVVTFATTLAVASTLNAFGAVGSEVAGTVRVQILSPTLVRLENKGPDGFEDRTTFHIVNRNGPGATYSRLASGGYALIQTSDFIVKVPTNATSLSGIIITKTNNTQIWSYSSLPDDRAWLPAITSNTWAWAIADNPRMVPASRGYNPAASGSTNYSSNGWDLNNNAADMYVFLPKGDVSKLRTDFLDLTGRTELIPLHGLGFWDSRWHDYTAQTALQQITDYRSHDIPLDVLVIDTGWRVGGSTGYDVNTTDFPNMTSFMNSVHANNVRVMFNDHPQPVASALDPTEVTFRNNGLRSLFQKGLDIWWYDRNWIPSYAAPSGINKEVWGMYVYDWITGDYYSTRRPLIMANVDGIDSGTRSSAPAFIAHRYPIQWTGDIASDFASLQREVDNAVYEGMYAASPYTACDLGGFTSDPDTEGYIRWIQYGSLAPVCRVHCTLDHTRMPWTFGAPAEDVSRKFIKMRYRLLPLFYASARRNYDTGEPILRRCDFDYSSYTEAGTNTQYLLGDAVLVAPVLHALPYTVVPSSWLKTTNGETGLTGQYFSNTNLSGSAVLTRTDTTVNFSWGTGNPGSGVPSDNFSARWTGNITIGTQDVVLAVTGDDGTRLYIDNNLVIDAWKIQNSILNETTVTFAKNTTHSIKLEYVEFTGSAVCKLQWRPVTVSQSVWIPPGNWVDAWTGNVTNGPQTISVNVPLEKMPLYIKPGTLVALAPDMSYTAQKPWDPITIDVYPSVDRTASFNLYEDDTVSKDYRTGSYRTTQITAATDNTNKNVTVTINPAQGTFSGASTNRSWVVRIHKPLEWENPTPSSAKVNGVAAGFSARTQDTNAMPFMNSGGSPDGNVAEITVPSGAVLNAQTVVVNYSTALSIICPSDVTVNADAGQCCASGVVLGSPTTSGVCSGTVTVVNNAPTQYPTGTNQILWTAMDSCSNVATCIQKVIVVDNQPPTVSIGAPVSSSVVSGNLSISGTASDNVLVQKVEVRLDTGDWFSAAGTTSWSFLLNTAGLLNGNHVISARSTDSSGNTSSIISVTVRFFNVPGAYLARISAGNPSSVTDCVNNVWVADQAYAPSSFGYSGGANGYIANVISNVCAAEYPLYQRERYSTSSGGFRYLFDCPVGVYEITLLEDETYWNATNQRVFNVFIEGQQVLTNFDIYAAAGGMNLAVTKVFTNAVSDAQLEILFSSLVDNARAAGIQVRKIADLDADGDGIPDWWMLGYFNHPTGQAADQSRAGDDPDGDGLSNLQEFLAGTNPLVFDSSLAAPSNLTATNVFENQIALKWQDNSSNELAFLILRAPSAAGPWSMVASLASNVTGYNDCPLAGGTTYFYEVVATNQVGVATSNVASATTPATNNVIAYDRASEPAYGGGWTNGSNGGTGFGPWQLIQTATGGFLLGTSVSNGWSTGITIDSCGEAFGLFANSGGNAVAYRALNTSLTIGQSLLWRMDNGWINTGSSVGIALRNGNTTNTVNNYNTGARFEFFFLGGSNDYYAVDSAGRRDTGVGYSSEALELEFTLTGTNTYSLHVTRLENNTSTIITGTLNGTAGSTIDSFALYNRNAGSGYQYDAFFNYFRRTNANFDSVGDGIPNWWRALYFGGDGSTTNVPGSCTLCDPDGDGMNNLQEYLTGTDPTDPTSAFRITKISIIGSDLAITWTTCPNQTNQLQRSNVLGPGVSWSSVGPLTITAGSFANQTDFGAATNPPAFYRVRRVP
jgi:hypothetical protein